MQCFTLTSYIHTYIHTYVCVPAVLHSYFIHTYTHTYICMRTCSCLTLNSRAISLSPTELALPRSESEALILKPEGSLPLTLPESEHKLVWAGAGLRPMPIRARRLSVNSLLPYVCMYACMYVCMYL